MRRHLRILDFALAGLARRPGKTAVVVTVYALLVALFASLLLYVNTLRGETRRLLADAPDLVVQRIRGGRHELVPLARGPEIAAIRGVADVRPRVWGYTFDAPTRATLTLWGADSLPADAVELSSGELPGDDDLCAVGVGLAEARFLGPGDRLPLLSADGDLMAPRVSGVFTASSAMLTNDLVVLSTGTARRVLGVPEDSCTDLAVWVHNPREVDTVARKILEAWPDARTVSRDQLLRTYDAVFDWRAGVWGAFLLCLVAAFAVLVWSAASGLSADEYRALGILRAVGWRSRDVLELKAWEGMVVSIVAVVTGVLAAEVHLVVFDGALFTRVLKGWSVLFPAFDLEPDLSGHAALVCLLFAVVPYVGATLWPIWRSAVIDPDAVIRS